MQLNDIIEKLYAIDRWNRANGFGNRGLYPVSKDADDLKKADELLAMAYATLVSRVAVYMKFYIEKTMENNPKLPAYYAEIWRRVRGGWLNEGPELRALYDYCVKINPQLKQVDYVYKKEK